MSLSNCPACGFTLDPRENRFCPHCGVAQPFERVLQGEPGGAYATTAADNALPATSYAAASPSAPAAEPPASWLDLLWAFLVWGVSGGFALTFEAATRAAIRLGYFAQPEMKLTPVVVIISLAITLLMHLLGFGAAWLAITRLGKRPFWRSLGWSWHPQFKWVHAVALAILMLGLAFAAEKLLPHRETELEQLLKMGLPIKVMVALLAVLTAPLIEELVYRGVVYGAIARLAGKATAIVLVALLFALVHVPQYWGSVAAITVISSLSLVLTLLRAWTNRLLPCVATHLVYNGIQAVALLASSGAPQQSQGQTAQALLAALQWLGLN